MNTNEEEQIRVDPCVLVLDFIHANDSFVSETAEWDSSVERVVINALVPRLRDGAAAGYLRLRRLLPSSSEKPIHLRLRLARDQPSPGFGLAGTPAANHEFSQDS